MWMVRFASLLCRTDEASGLRAPSGHQMVVIFAQFTAGGVATTAAAKVEPRARRAASVSPSDARSARTRRPMRSRDARGWLVAFSSLWRNNSHCLSSPLALARARPWRSSGYLHQWLRWRRRPGCGPPDHSLHRREDRGHRCACGLGDRCARDPEN